MHSHTRARAHTHTHIQIMFSKTPKPNPQHGWDPQLQSFPGKSLKPRNKWPEPALFPCSKAGWAKRSLKTPLSRGLPEDASCANRSLPIWRGAGCEHVFNTGRIRREAGHTNTFNTGIWLSSSEQKTFCHNLILGNLLYFNQAVFSVWPWYNCNGWLGVKHQVTYLLSSRHHPVKPCVWHTKPLLSQVSVPLGVKHQVTYLLSSRQHPVKLCIDIQSCYWVKSVFHFLVCFTQIFSVGTGSQNRYTWCYYSWPTDMWQTDQQACWPCPHFSLTPNLFQPIKQKMHRAKKCKSYNANSEISLSAKLRVACLPEIMEFIRANPWCSSKI